MHRVAPPFLIVFNDQFQIPTLSASVLYTKESINVILKCCAADSLVYFSNSKIYLITLVPDVAEH